MKANLLDMEAIAATSALRRQGAYLAVAVLGALATLFGCAQSGAEKHALQSGDRELRVRPLPLTVTATPASGDYYTLGRQAYAKGELGEAEAAFRHALRLEPEAVEALNALAVVHDRLGQFAISSGEYQTALQLAPDAPHILANLGYSLLLQDRAEEALAPLRRAIELAPENRVTRANLARAEAATAQDAAPSAALSAAPSAASDVAEPGAEPMRHGIVLSVIGPSQPPLDASSGQAQLAMPMIASVQGAEIRTSPALGGIFAGTRIEIANGNGVTGMALAMRAKLRADGFRVTRATNALPYNKRHTVIVCDAARRPLAEELATRLAVAPRLIIASTQYRNVDLRLILGADLVPGAARPATAGKLALLED